MKHQFGLVYELDVILNAALIEESTAPPTMHPTVYLKQAGYGCWEDGRFIYHRDRLIADLAADGGRAVSRAVAGAGRGAYYALLRFIMNNSGA
jgi:hypothetical protein